MIALSANDPNGNPWIPGGAQEMALHALGAGAIAWTSPPETDVAVNLSGYAAALTAAEAQLAAQVLAGEALGLLQSGLTLTSTGTSSLNGVYPVTPTLQQQINAEVTSILLNNTFADGGSTIEWPDASNASHSFDIAHFKAFATAIAAFATGCIKCTNGQSNSLPSASATIA